MFRKFFPVIIWKSIFLMTDSKWLRESVQITGLFVWICPSFIQFQIMFHHFFFIFYHLIFQGSIFFNNHFLKESHWSVQTVWSPRRSRLWTRPKPFNFFKSIRKGRIRQRTALNLNDFGINRFWEDTDMTWISYELTFKIQSRSMSDSTLSDIDFKNKMSWARTTLYFWKFART